MQGLFCSSTEFEEDIDFTYVACLYSFINLLQEYVENHIRHYSTSKNRVNKKTTENSGKTKA